MEDRRFIEFILLQAQNAGLFLGKIPHPATGEAEVNLRAAQSVIETLEIIKERTNGNLTEKEGQLLDKTLFHVRELYMQTSQQELRP